MHYALWMLSRDRTDGHRLVAIEHRDEATVNYATRSADCASSDRLPGVSPWVPGMWRALPEVYFALSAMGSVIARRRRARGLRSGDLDGRRTPELREVGLRKTRG